MLMDEWVETVWQVIGVRKKTIQDYKNLYRRHLQPIIGHMPVNEIDIFPVQQKLLALSPQTGRHCLMVLKTIAREGLLYKVITENFAQSLYASDTLSDEDGELRKTVDQIMAKYGSLIK